MSVREETLKMSCRCFSYITYKQFHSFRSYCQTLKTNEIKIIVHCNLIPDSQQRKVHDDLNYIP